MKKNHKILIAAMVGTLAFAAMPTNIVFAATTPTWVDGSTITITRSIPNLYGTVNNTFTYTIEDLYDSGATGAPTSSSITFNGNYTTQGTVTKTATIDFGSMSFDYVGDYMYEVSETASSNNALYPVDSENTYTVVISVRNNDYLTGYEAYLGVLDKNGDKVSDISGDDSEFHFETAPVYTNIEAWLLVAGNMADPYRCFEYQITFNTPDKYKLTTDSICDNPDTVGSGDTIRLMNNDTLSIGIVGTTSQIPVGTNYTITRLNPDYYVTGMDGVETTTVSKTAVATNDSTYNTANSTGISEVLNEGVDTGAFINTTIYILLALAGTAGIIYFVYKKKNQNV